MAYVVIVQGGYFKYPNDFYLNTILVRENLCFVPRRKIYALWLTSLKKKKRQTEMTWRGWEVLVILSDPLDLNVLV